MNEAYHLISFGIGFHPVSVNYPAARVQTLFPHPATYFDSISIGVNFTLTRLIRAARPTACPRQPIVLAGYSQGAMVMHRVVRTLATTPAYSAIAARIAAVVLVGDGDQIPSDNVTRFGTAKNTVSGIGLGRPSLSHTSDAKLPAMLKVKLLQVCNADDAVCGWPDVKTAKKCISDPLLSACSKRIALGIWVHLHYMHKKSLIAAARRAASLLADALRKSGPKPPSANRPADDIPHVPHALWNEPMGDDAMIIPAADGSLITTKCSFHSTRDADVPYTVQQVAPNGSLDWRRGSDNSDCLGNIRDAAGNDYYFMTDNAGAHIRSVNARGWVRWTTAALPNKIDRVYYATPALGANGDAYFVVYNGFGTGFLLGVNEGTGAVTTDEVLGFPLAIYAYTAGLVVADGSDTVEYLRYDGTPRATYNIPGIDFTGASFAGGTAGTIFATGPSSTSSCSGTIPFRVMKITPAGIAWTWTDPRSSCSARGDAAATPDGGVVTTEWAGSRSTTGYVESLGINGSQRWRMPLTATAHGLLFAATPIVDDHGVVVIPRYTEYNCASIPGNTCVGLRVLFASQASKASSRATINVTNETYTISTGGDPWGWNVAIAASRIYVDAVPYLDNTTYPTSGDALTALAAPGLSQDYRLALQQR